MRFSVVSRENGVMFWTCFASAAADGIAGVTRGWCEILTNSTMCAVTYHVLEVVIDGCGIFLSVYTHRSVES